jgi:hypothetical protein
MVLLQFGEVGAVIGPGVRNVITFPTVSSVGPGGKDDPATREAGLPLGTEIA